MSANGNENMNAAGETPTQPPVPPVTGAQRPRNYRRNAHNRQGMFMHYLFLNLTLRYVSYFKSKSRRLIEFFSLVNALLMFIILLYIHVTFVRNSGECLNHVKDIWPQSGILRVQVSGNLTEPPYRLLFVKENSFSSASIESTPYNIVLKYASSLKEEDIVNYKIWKQLVVGQQSESSSLDDSHNGTCPNNKLLQQLHTFHLLKAKCPIVKQQYIDDFKNILSSNLASVVADISVQYSDNDIVKLTKELPDPEYIEPSPFDPLEPSPIRDHYIIEYSAEFGYLRLSTAARHKLGIPTLVVNLNPEMDMCFGSDLKRYMLKTFLGYDDFLMSSIKNLAENDKAQGYLRNRVTGEYFRFVTVWVNRASGIIAFSVMIIFTLIVSMLLRYSYHQIFMFMIEILRILDTDVRLVFPLAPMLTIVLALVGMEEIMTEFFHDSTVAFYVILLIWGADQFDVICLHTVIGRRQWVRFFYLYHLAFYIYNYKFNGQYSKLALFTSWLFTFHSMLYFLHHYEIPAIHRLLLVRTERDRRRLAASNNNSPMPPSDHQDNDANSTGSSSAETILREPEASAGEPGNNQEVGTEGQQQDAGLSTQGDDTSESAPHNVNMCRYVRTFTQINITCISVTLLAVTCLIAGLVHSLVFASTSTVEVVKFLL